MYYKPSPAKLGILLATPAILYLVPYFALLGIGYAVVLFLPLGFIVATSLYKFRGINLKTYGILYLYLFSQAYFSYRNNFLQGMVTPITLVIFLHAATDYGNSSIATLNKICKFLFIGICVTFVCCIFVPLLLKFPYVPKSWYFIASKEIPIISTTMDGPFLLIIIVAMIILTFRKNRNTFNENIIFFLILVIAFYTLIVFNRRMILLFYCCLIPFTIYQVYSKRFFYRFLLIASFLVPLNFLIIIKYAGDIASNDLVQDIVLRSDDLNDKNSRLTGWILAIDAFKDVSMDDFFGYHKVLVRSLDDRYNHFHNGYIQLYYEQGIFGFAVTLILLFQLCGRIKAYKNIDFRSNKILYLFPIIFAFILLLSITESTFRRLSIFHIFFIISAYMILRTSDELKKQRTATFALVSAEEEIIEDDEPIADKEKPISDNEKPITEVV